MLNKEEHIIADKQEQLDKLLENNQNTFNENENYPTYEQKYLYAVNYLSMTKKYDKKINMLYHNSQILIDDNLYHLDKLMIDFNNKDKSKHLRCIGSGYTDILTKSKEKFDFNDFVRFKDTTAFIKLLKSDKISIITNSLIMINDNDILVKVINEWDGFLHSAVPETDAVLDKDVFNRENK